MEGFDVLIFRRFLQAYWLRPENAMWMTLRSLALRQCELRGPVFGKPTSSVDLGCGDGVFSFLHCGGVFDPDFDVFHATKSVGEPTHNPVEPASLPHNPVEQASLPADAGQTPCVLDTGTEAGATEPDVDMFDHMSDDYRPVVRSRPTSTIDVGVDIKATMLAKAGRLDFYDRLVEHDNNQPLPFDDDAFETVYCNTAYWVGEIDRFLAELGRITCDGGSIILHVKLASMKDYTLESFREVLGDRCLARLARGRMECWPAVADRATWESRFAGAGLTIQDATPFVTRTHAHIWDVGLRPFAPMLVKLAGGVSPETRASVKAEWIDVCLDLLTPLCDPSIDLFSQDSDPAEIQYVLTPA